jgi:phosphoribosylamine--glycine ligase
MNFHLYSKCGEGCGLALRLQEEGNKVSVFIREREYRSVYKGILKQSKNFPDDAIVVFDSSGMGSEAEAFKKSGKKVFGGSIFADKIEMDRKFGLDLMTKAGIQIPETKEFNNVDDAIEFLHSSDEDYVFKPSGDLPSKLTYKPCDKEDLIKYLEFVEEEYDLADFVLQEVVEGCALSTEFFLGKSGFVGSATHTIEVKKFMNCDLGPSTGCAGNTVWRAEDFITKKLKEAEKIFRSRDYIGPIDLNAIVNSSGFYGLEWTPRFGLDAMPTWLQLLKCDVGEVISGLIDGSLKEIELSEDFSSGVRVTIPPYPIEPESLKGIQRDSPNYGVPIRGVTDESKFYFYEVCQENGDYYHSDGTGVIAVVSNTDSDIRTSFESVYEILEDLKIPDKQYRTDLGEVIPELYDEVVQCLD